MKFVWLDKDKYPNQIPFLKGNCEDTGESIDPDVVVYRIKKETDTIFSQMKVMESCGFLKIMKEVNELEDAEDILHMTRRVEKLKSTSGSSSPMYLKVHFPHTTFLLTESELLSPTKFRKCLLREGKFIFISGKVWVPLVQAWLDMSEEIREESEDEQIIDRVLNYLVNCVVHEDVGKAVSRNTLYHDKEDDGVAYCHIDSVMEVINSKKKDEISNRKLRVILSEYIDGDSIQKRIYNNRYRFWRFKIEKVHIDLERQLFNKDELEKDEEGNNAQQKQI